MGAIMVENIEEYEVCRRCHRKLKDNKSRKIGLGPVCYKKYIEKQKTYLFEMGENNEVTIEK